MNSIATPTRLFDLEDGVPTDAYALEEAVRDGFLVPAQAVSVPLRFQREGIKYADLPDDEKDAWDALEWDEDGNVPASVEAEAVNKWLFNKDTVDKVLAHLMTRGMKVAGGDRLGKTILFAKNQAHAEYIEERFNANYPHLKGQFARVITFKTEYAQSLIDAFSVKERAPHLALSVDMLDTGIDVPEVVNLVFFKLVRSKTKFWQMVGRGTRLCRDLFGPGLDKASFYLFDYCQNLEYFSQDLPTSDGAGPVSLGTRLFVRRVELIVALDELVPPAWTPAFRPALEVREIAPAYGDPLTEARLREAVAEGLHREVAAMNLDNFVVRPKRRLVERFARPESWTTMTPADAQEVSYGLAGLPTELDPEPEEAKRFDLLLLNLQLAVLRHEPAFERLRDQVKTIAGLLEEKSPIPMIRDQMALIQDVQSDEWWRDVTTPMLELVRRRLRDLVGLIEKRARKIIYTDFEDLLGPEMVVDLPGFGEGMDFAKFRAKTQAFLRAHQDHAAIRKLRMNETLTRADLDSLEHIMLASGAAEAEVRRLRTSAEGLGLFVRSLVGLDREAAKTALGEFVAGKTLTANQIQFVNLIVDHLTEHGVIEVARLYESPFTDLTPRGPDALFNETHMAELLETLDRVRSRATAA